MGRYCKPHVFVLDFLQLIGTEAEIDNMLFPWRWVDITDSISWSPWVLKTNEQTKRLSLYSSNRNFSGFSGTGDLRETQEDFPFTGLRLWPFEEFGCIGDGDRGKTGQTHTSFTQWPHNNTLTVIQWALVSCCWTFLFLLYYASMPVIRYIYSYKFAIT